MENTSSAFHAKEQQNYVFRLLQLIWVCSPETLNYPRCLCHYVSIFGNTSSVEVSHVHYMKSSVFYSVMWSACSKFISLLNILLVIIFCFWLFRWSRNNLTWLKGLHEGLDAFLSASLKAPNSKTSDAFSCLPWSTIIAVWLESYREDLSIQAWCAATGNRHCELKSEFKKKVLSKQALQFNVLTCLFWRDGLLAKIRRGTLGWTQAQCFAKNGKKQWLLCWLLLPRLLHLSDTLRKWVQSRELWEALDRKLNTSR